VKYFQLLLLVISVVVCACVLTKHNDETKTKIDKRNKCFIVNKFCRNKSIPNACEGIKRQSRILKRLGRKFDNAHVICALSPLTIFENFIFLLIKYFSNRKYERDAIATVKRKLHKC
jgi:hypothetical protein